MGIIEPHPTMYILDSTKIKAFMECPRKYLLEYIFGWRLKKPSRHLVFGAAIHAGMEAITRTRLIEPEPVLIAHYLPPHFRQEKFHSNKFFQERGYPFGIDEVAYVYFLEDYRKTFQPITDNDEKKNPALAQRIFKDYIEYYKMDEFDTLHTEVPFVIPVFVEPDNPDAEPMQVYGKIDAVIQDDKGKYWILEHKTGSQNSNTWKNQFTLSVQVGMYIHALNCVYGIDNVAGCIINGTICTQTPQFIRLPIRKNKTNMRRWMDNTSAWVRDIKFCTDALIIHDTNLFIMNTTSCTNYFGCQFHDYCIHWDDILSYYNKMPPEFERKYWDPRERIDQDKEVVKIYN